MESLWRPFEIIRRRERVEPQTSVPGERLHCPQPCLGKSSASASKTSPVPHPILSPEVIVEKHCCKPHVNTLLCDSNQKWPFPDEARSAKCSGSNPAFSSASSAEKEPRPSSSAGCYEHVGQRQEEDS